MKEFCVIYIKSVTTVSHSFKYFTGYIRLSGTTFCLNFVKKKDYLQQSMKALRLYKTCQVPIVRICDRGSDKELCSWFYITKSFYSRKKRLNWIYFIFLCGSCRFRTLLKCYVHVIIFLLRLNLSWHNWTSKISCILMV